MTSRAETDEHSSPYPFFFTWSAQNEAEPMQITGGSGAWFDVADGSRWLDMGSLTYHVNAGHGHRRIIDAVRRQAEDLCIAMPNSVYPAKEQLAERLLDLAPPGFSKVFFALGGAEANENALKIARMVTGRHKLISRYRSYHGATMGALSLTGDYRRPPLEPGLAGVVHAMDCYCDQCPFGLTVETCSRECASHIGQVIELEGPETVAAVVLEPVPGANGVLVPPPEYWPMVRDACDKHGVLLVADEVLTGFGRTGRWFAHRHFGAVPDMITVGKALTGGYGALSAVLVHERVAEHFDENMLFAGLTNYAHPLGCAAALEAIRVYDEEGLIDRAAELGPLLAEELEALCDAHPDHIRSVRCLGLLAAVELEAEPEDIKELKQLLRERRVHIHARKREGIIILSPPLCIKRDELRRGVNLISEAIDAWKDTTS